MSENPIRLIVGVLWDTLGTFTGIVGLTQLQAIAVVGALIVAFLGWSFVQAVRGNTKFTLE